MTPVVADTHALIWFFFTPQTLSKRAFEALNDAVQSGGIYLTSISIVEIVYLIEKGKLPSNSLQRLITELYHPKTAFEIVPLDLVISTTMQQIPRVDVPDMPDRIIAATALHRGLPLVTKDHRIQSTAINCIW